MLYGCALCCTPFVFGSRCKQKYTPPQAIVLLPCLLGSDHVDRTTRRWQAHSISSWRGCRPREKMVIHNCSVANLTLCDVTSISNRPHSVLTPCCIESDILKYNFHIKIDRFSVLTPWCQTAARQQPDSSQTGTQQPDSSQIICRRDRLKQFQMRFTTAAALASPRKRPAAAQTPGMRDATGRLARLKQRSGYCGLCCCIILDFTGHKSRRPACKTHQDSRVLNDEVWRALEAEFWEEQVDPNAVKRRRVDSAKERHAKQWEATGRGPSSGIHRIPYDLRQVQRWQRNVSVDISPGDSPSLRDALVAYETGNMDAEDDLPCTRWKMAGARTKELSTVGRRTRQERSKSPKTRPIRLLSCATKTCLGVTSCEVSLHQGDARKSGHYTCSGRNGYSWHYFDDSSMREVGSRTVLASQAYMLMRERV